MFSTLLEVGVRVEVGSGSGLGVVGVGGAELSNGRKRQNITKMKQSVKRQPWAAEKYCQAAKSINTAMSVFDDDDDDVTFCGTAGSYLINCSTHAGGLVSGCTGACECVYAGA